MLWAYDEGTQHYVISFTEIVLSFLDTADIVHVCKQPYNKVGASAIKRSENLPSRSYIFINAVSSSGKEPQMFVTT